jgi:fructosamine-3-kinase
LTELHSHRIITSFNNQPTFYVVNALFVLSMKFSFTSCRLKSLIIVVLTWAAHAFIATELVCGFAVSFSCARRQQQQAESKDLLFSNDWSQITTRGWNNNKGRDSHILGIEMSSTGTSASSSSISLLDAISEACSKSLGREVKLEPASGGGFSGGGGAQTSAATDTMSPTGEDKYFIKSAPSSSGGGKMLKAEYMGVKEMSDTNTIKVPKPVAYGEGAGPMCNSAFVVFEYLNLGGGGAGGSSQRELGRQLALLHKCFSENGKFGFHIDNTIGSTPQPNQPWLDDWADFWDEHRLGHMLKLTGNAGLSDQDAAKLRSKTRELLSQHSPPPSLLHRDLWGGNKGFAKMEDGSVVPVIFDPATYYGDRESDLAMTDLFGGFGADFYQGYKEEWPLPDGHEKRLVVYNLYHM